MTVEEIQRVEALLAGYKRTQPNYTLEQIAMGFEQSAEEDRSMARHYEQLADQYREYASAHADLCLLLRRYIEHQKQRGKDMPKRGEL